ncbi:hypothetical protein [Butyrivibrio sp. AE3004]|uniref:hypothetical protein n=1 Tax=Butyrivibrio sp. AE3004 TaxID=1506994 RepID=UPI0004949B1D|nr:hypothetical protein [Butyrivibrio sp. AE3004]
MPDEENNFNATYLSIYCIRLVGCAEVSSDKETVNAPTTEISVAETSGVTDIMNRWQKRII